MAEDRTQLMRLAGLGPHLVGSLAIGALIGWYLDDRFDTEPYLLILFILLGLASGVREFIRALISLERAEEEEQEHDP